MNEKGTEAESAEADGVPVHGVRLRGAGPASSAGAPPARLEEVRWSV